MISFVVRFIALLPFYLLGSFPTGWLIARFYGVDIASQGSGNVGATNISRVIGKRAGIFTLLGDVGKGALAVGIASIVSPIEWYTAGAAAAAVCGHCFSLPPWLKGGKGVATALGAILVLLPVGAVFALLTFGTVFAFSRLVSLASLSATAMVPLYALVTNQSNPKIVALVLMSAVIVYRHRQNITRIIEGREPRFTARKDQLK